MVYLRSLNGSIEFMNDYNMVIKMSATKPIILKLAEDLQRLKEEKQVLKSKNLLLCDSIKLLVTQCLGYENRVCELEKKLEQYKELCGG